MTNRLAIAVSLTLFACTPAEQTGPSTGAPTKTPATAVASDTKVTAFTVDDENLQVDKVGMKDGQLHPDGNRDHAFSATIDGAFDAVFVIETNQKGEPIYGYRADSLVGSEELPRELGGVIDTGTMTIGLAVSENGKFISGESGSVSLPPGIHQIKIYSPNTNTLVAGDFIRLYVRTASGALAASPIATY